jgi:hypothetical protein
VRHRWLSPRALALHAAVAIVVPGCLYAGWWQATRAMSGNFLSYLYAVEWPVFAIIAVVGWWFLIHDDPDTVGARGLRRALKASPQSARSALTPQWVRHREDEDDELRAYNDYLAALAESDRTSDSAKARGRR